MDNRPLTPHPVTSYVLVGRKLISSTLKISPPALSVCTETEQDAIIDGSVPVVDKSGAAADQKFSR